MNMLVCVKQVPDTTEIKIDPVKNALIRDGVPSILNPFDGYALEAAARIKDKDPSAKIVVLSMGPEQAKAVLKESLAIAADKAYLVSDRAFGGSDTLATSYIISETIKKIEETEGKFDAIFCGKQAIDGPGGPGDRRASGLSAGHLRSGGRGGRRSGEGEEGDGRRSGRDRREDALRGDLHEAGVGPPLPHHQAQDGREQG